MGELGILAALVAVLGMQPENMWERDHSSVRPSILVDEPVVILALAIIPIIRPSNDIEIKRPGQDAFALLLGKGDLITVVVRHPIPSAGSDWPIAQISDVEASVWVGTRLLTTNPEIVVNDPRYAASVVFHSVQQAWRRHIFGTRTKPAYGHGARKQVGSAGSHELPFCNLDTSLSVDRRLLGPLRSTPSDEGGQSSGYERRDGRERLNEAGPTLSYGQPKVPFGYTKRTRLDFQIGLLNTMVLAGLGTAIFLGSALLSTQPRQLAFLAAVAASMVALCWSLGALLTGYVWLLW